ncbi:MAG: hypothetical protein K8T90_22410 [Planctomycetes bacterium]|nr:hypothetical protein [Planctomycetota bacterium]
MRAAYFRWERLGPWALVRAARAVAVVAAIALSLAAAPPSARADGGDRLDVWRRARVEAPARLRAHAAWCAERKLVAERLAAFERVLALVPDDADARRALRYVKMKDGSWKRSKTDAPPPSPAELATDAARRLDEALLPLRSSAIQVFEDAELPMAERERALDDRLAVDPDDPDVRTADAETNVGGKWVLDETVRTRERGAELKATAAAALKEFAKPDASSATADELALAGPVAEVFSNAAARVVGAAGTKEARAAAVAVAASQPVWSGAFATDPPRVPELRFYLFPAPAAGHAAVDRDDTMTAETRTWVKTLDSAWRPKRNDCLIWAAEAPNRVEFALRQALQVQVTAAFEVTEKRGWAYEGIGHWFSEVVLSAHHCTFVRRPDYADAGGPDARAQRLEFLRGSRDWLLAARELAGKPEWPGIRAVLGKDVNGLAPDELLVSYVLARYLIEGRADVAVRAFTEAGRGMAPDAWAEGCLGFTIEGLDRRIRRWLRETGEK